MEYPESVQYLGKPVEVRDILHVGRRSFLLLERIGHGQHKRYWVYDRSAGPNGFRQVLAIPREKTSRKHLEVLQRLSQGNPNLPTIIQLIPQADEIFVVTDWVRGVDLKSYLKKRHPGMRRWPSPTETMRLLRGLAHGLRHIHRHRRIVHRDIKPANLVFAKQPNRLVMIDFGSAWMVEKSHERIVGDGTSEHYAAPELQQDPPKADFRSDQFSATVVAYQMLTGELPYSGIGGKAGRPQNRGQYEQLYRPPSRISKQRRELPTRIWQLIDETIARGLMLDADRRYPTDSAWLDALEDVHCEIRRRVQFNRREKAMIRLFEWLARRSGKKK